MPLSRDFEGVLNQAAYESLLSKTCLGANGQVDQKAFKTAVTSAWPTLNMLIMDFIMV